MTNPVPPHLNADTIAAQATPPGHGGIAIVRVSGLSVNNVIQAVLGCDLKPRQATYLPFRGEDGDAIDEGVAVFFPQPHSFTGEDVLELHGHGGPVVVDLLLQRILRLEGVRLARPGEFSERAFMNGKIDLAQAEAIADLISAVSQQAARSAVRSLQGEFSKQIQDLNEKIIYLRMYVEAAIDFTDEEIDFLGDEKISAALQAIIHQLSDILQKAKQGSLLREGVTAVIAGEPNVGKSSLLNCLSGKDIAIVTDIPGTTRDVLRDHVLIDGIPLYVIDTAGLRESEDIVEQEGIRRAWNEIEKADIILFVTEVNTDAEVNINPYADVNADTHTDTNTKNEVNAVTIDAPAMTAVCSRIQSHQPILYIRNKIDLVNELPAVYVNEGKTVISLSAKSGIGIELLKNRIKQEVGFCSSDEGIFLARRRHLDALIRAQTHIKESLNQLQTSRHGELAAEDLRQAHLALCEITGEFTSDDLLGRIFSTFCVGK